MSGGFFRGTSADQDTRFSNKQAKLMKSQKFASELEHLVDTRKVKMDVMKPWIANRVTELLGFEDEVLINFIYTLLDGKEVNGKEVQISLTGFMEKNTAKFMKELWTLLLSAQSNESGVPQQFLDAKQEETRKKQAELDKITSEIQKKKERESRETERERSRKMDGGVDTKVNDAAMESASKHTLSKGTTVHTQEEKESEKRNGVRGRARASKSPRSTDRLSLSPRYSPSRIRKSLSNSRSYSGDRRKSRSVSRSPNIKGRSTSSERVHRSPRKQSITPRRRNSSQLSISPPRRRSSYSRKRSRSSSRRRSPSLVRRPRLYSPYWRRSPSPIWRRRSRSPVRRRKLSRSPVRRGRSPSPVRRGRSPSPVRRGRSPSSMRRGRSPSPVRRGRSPSPVRRGRSPSPVRRGRSPSPVRRGRSPSPRRTSPSLVRRRSPRRRSPSPLYRRPQRSPSTPRQRSPSPIRNKSPLPVRQRSPAPRRRSPSPYDSSSPSAVRRRSPLPPPARRRSPNPSNRRSPYEYSSPSPTRGRSSSPAMKRSLKEPRRSLVQSPVQRLGTRGKTSPVQRRPSGSSSPSPKGSAMRSESPVSPQNRSSGQFRRSSSSSESLVRQRRGHVTNDGYQSPLKPRELKPRHQSPETSEENGKISSVRTSQKRSGHSSTISKLKDSPAKRSFRSERSPEMSAGRHAKESQSHPSKVESRKKDQEMKGERSLGRWVHPETLDGQESPILATDPLLKGAQRQSLAGESHKSDETNHLRLNSVKDSDGRYKSVTTPVSVGKAERDDNVGAFDSGSEESDKRRTENKEKRKHKRSHRRETASDDDYSYGSESEDRKEAKKRRKEEKKLRKEEKRRRREERRRKKEGRHAEKLKSKDRNHSSSSEDEHVGGKESYPSDDEEMLPEQKRLEIELRKKALESLKAKKGIGH